MKHIKKTLSAFLFLGLIGCANNNAVNIDKKIEITNIDQKLMKKYHITTDNLLKFNNYYIFASPSPNGTDIVFLDKNYKEVKKFSTSYFLDVKKIAISNGKIYIIGINETTYYPELLILDRNGKLIKKIKIPKKYGVVKDLYLSNGDNYILVDVFSNGKSYIEIYKNGKLLKKIELKQPINGTFVFKMGNDLFVIGVARDKDENAFIFNTTKGWIRFFDLGMDEMIDNYKIDGDKIILTLHSTDEMGADSYYEVVIDKNGKIIKSKCKVKFAPLPMRFRT